MAKKLTTQEFQEFVVERLEATEQFKEFVVEQFGVLHADIGELRDGLAEVRQKIEDVDVTLQPLSAAFDKDTVKTIEHDRRLTRVEKHLGLHA